MCAPVRLSAPAERGPRSCIALKGEEGALLLPAPISSAAGDREFIGLAQATFPAAGKKDRNDRKQSK